MGKLERFIDKAKAEQFYPDEKVIEAVLGQYETKMMGQDTTRSGALIATSKRLVFFAKKVGGYEFESFPYEHISSLEQGKQALVGHWIKFYSANDAVKVKWIKEGDVDKFLKRVEEKIESATASEPTPATAVPSEKRDIPGEIKKLAELHQAGILTDEEFHKKKTQLLEQI